MRVIRIAMLVAIVSGLLAAVTPARAGGSCPTGYDARNTTTVVMDEACFSPTVNHVEVNDTVTFLNKDKYPHMVGGVAGSFGDLHEELAPGKSLSFEMRTEGVYPYVCILHPGMAGAIVVGDGKGKGNLAAIDPVAAPPTRPDPEPAAERVATSTSEWKVPLWVPFLVLLLGLGVFALRRRSTAGLPVSKI